MCVRARATQQSPSWQLDGSDVIHTRVGIHERWNSAESFFLSCCVCFFLLLLFSQIINVDEITFGDGGDEATWKIYDLMIYSDVIMMMHLSNPP